MRQPTEEELAPIVSGLRIVRELHAEAAIEGAKMDFALLKLSGACGVPPGWIWSFDSGEWIKGNKDGS